jgi:hypothetical protein
LLRATKGKIDIHEFTFHALAVSSRAKNVSYALNPLSDYPKAFLGILAVGVEYTFKYFEQYFRWPAGGMQLSRQTTLASWSYSFFERGITDYNNTKTEITLSGLNASSHRRTQISDPRVKYIRVAFEFYAALYALRAGPAAVCSAPVQKAIALAMSLPGFRKRMMSLPNPMTVIVPTSDDARDVIEALYNANDAQLLFKFFLMHVMPGRLALKHGQAFILEAIAGQPPHERRFRIAEPALLNTLSTAVTGHVASPATYINDGLIAYAANMKYGAASDLVRQLA